ncbi:MAG: CDP-alcohol phosphatidyltransferase family protein, partial [Hyphomicrobiales bacterium]|nr:CDP-alcohol phosphatidyltransferase family protein [Hyphomicrobiales bacterium]
MTLYALKPRFQALLRPVAADLARRGVTANQVTLAAAFGSVAFGGIVAVNADTHWLFLLLPAWFLARMALNAIDGMLAR